MRFGLWRYKWEKWSPRPYSFYYAALCRTLRLGTVFTKVNGLSSSLKGCAGTLEGKRILGLVNMAESEARIEVAAKKSFVQGVGLHIVPNALTPATPYPLKEWKPIAGGHALTFELPANSLLLWREE